MNVTVLPYLDQEYVNSLYQTMNQANETAQTSASSEAATDFATTLEEAVNAIPPASTDDSAACASTAESTAAVSSAASVLCTNESLEAIFQKAADTYGVSVNLLKAIAKAESGFQQYATSHSGAMGIMQLMPATAAGLGVTDAYDPEQNIMGGANLISQLLVKYNGDVSLALAAYNAGSGNVDKYGGIPPFTETQNYVSKILGYLGGEVNVSVPASSNSALASMSDETKEAVNSALNVIFSKLDVSKTSLDIMVDLVNAAKSNS